MENTPEAAGEAPVAPQTEATPINANETPAAPDMHGFTSDQLAEMQKFFAANGGFDKIKSRISNPEPVTAAQPQAAEPAQPTQEPTVPQPVMPSAPTGNMTMNEYFAKRYFMDLAAEEKYSGIADDLRSGNILKEMSRLGIKAVYSDGSIDEDVLTEFLDLKAKTVPAKQSSAMPEASPAPTVDYIPVGESIESMAQAQQIILQDTQLRRQGKAGHPSVKMAEDYMREVLSGKKK